VGCKGGDSMNLSALNELIGVYDKIVRVPAQTATKIAIVSCIEDLISQEINDIYKRKRETTKLTDETPF
jgi:hypothetical protein